HVADGVVLAVRALDGEFIGTRAGVPPTFDDPRSYTLRIRSADLALDPASLTTLLSKQAFSAPASPVQDVVVTIEHGALMVRGKLRKKVAVPFSMVAEVSAAEE